MGIFRCSPCGVARDVADRYLGRQVRCPKCRQVTVITAVAPNPPPLKPIIAAPRPSDSRQDLRRSLQEQRRLVQEKRRLQAELRGIQREKQTLQTEIQRLQQPVSDSPSLPLVNAEHGESRPEAQHGHWLPRPETERRAGQDVLARWQPIIEWFGCRQGHSDEQGSPIAAAGHYHRVATLLGDHYDILAGFLKQICQAQRQGHRCLTIRLDRYPSETAKIIGHFCRIAGESGFFTRYAVSKPKRQISIYLQNNKDIREFFQSSWLEWFGFGKVAAWLLSRDRQFSCLRSADTLFFLLDRQTPLWIECHSPERPTYLDQHRSLRQRLAIPRSHAIALIVERSTSALIGQEVPQEITLVNQKSLLPYVAQLT